MVVGALLPVPGVLLPANDVLTVLVEELHDSGKYGSATLGRIATVIAEERARWTRVVKASGAKPN